MKPRVTLQELPRKLNYDPESGKVTWKYTSARGGWVEGEEAGTVCHSSDVAIRVVRVIGSYFDTPTLAWILKTGIDPRSLHHHVYHKDGNRLNTAWDNLDLAEGVDGDAKRLLWSVRPRPAKKARPKTKAEIESGKLTAEERAARGQAKQEEWRRKEKVRRIKEARSNAAIYEIREEYIKKMAKAEEDVVVLTSELRGVTTFYARAFDNSPDTTLVTITTSIADDIEHADMSDIELEELEARVVRMRATYVHYLSACFTHRDIQRGDTKAALEYERYHSKTRQLEAQLDADRAAAGLETYHR